MTLRGAVSTRTMLLLGVPVAVVVAALVLWLAGRPLASTENAYVKADIVQVAPDVAGRVVAVNVRDHARVAKGDVLVELDPEPYRLALAKADAELDQARVQVATLRLQWSEAGMELREAESAATFADQQLTRQRQLAQRGVAAATKLEEADNKAVAARDHVLVLREKLRRTLTALGDPEQPVDRHPLVREKQASRERAALDLARTRIVAPSGGVTVNVKVQPGEQVKAATPFLAIVADREAWVEANFKETDLTYVQPGQKATITLDAYPGLRLEAMVESVSPATGAEFAILPPQNAAGNWVKIVQRLPVRLRILSTPRVALRAGMTAHVEIDTGRDRRIASLLGWSGDATARPAGAEAPGGQ